METLNWGILGTGNIARQFAAGVAGSLRSRIVAVGSRAGATAEVFGKEFSISAVHGSYEALLRDDAVEAIYVSAPNHVHEEWTVAALNAGKHVLCEKPFALDEAQSARMFTAAESNRKVLVEAFMYRSHPLCDAVVKAVREGAIGAVRTIRTSFCYRTNRPVNNVRFDRRMGGGGLMDVGCYCIDFSKLIADAEPVRVSAFGRFEENGVDDVCVGTMEFPGGVLATFQTGMCVQSDNTAMICGTEGYIEVPIPWKPPVANAEFTIARGVPPRMDGGKGGLPSAAPRETRRVDAPAPLYALEADDFAATVLDGAPPRVTREQTLSTMRVLDEMRRQIGLSFE